MQQTPFDRSAPLSRRTALQLLAAGTATLALPAQALARATLPKADAVLDGIAWSLLDHVPEGATGLGVDIGEHAGLRARLEDRSQAGRNAYAATLRKGLAAVKTVDAKALDHSTRTSLAVVNSAFSTALDGFALPYGDVAVGGWRNTPYVVIQNVGAYLDTPKFLDADHPVKTPADADAYVARLGEFDAQLDGELGRIRAATDMGLVPPDFLLDRAIAQMTSTIADARKDGGGLVTSIAERTKTMSGSWAAEARKIVAGEVVPRARTPTGRTPAPARPCQGRPGHARATARR